MFGEDFNHTLGNLLTCLDEGCVGNAWEDVRIEGETSMCHDIEALKIMNMKASMCLEHGKAQRVRYTNKEAGHSSSRSI